MNIGFLLDNKNLSNYNYNLIKIAQNHFENNKIYLIFDDVNDNFKKIKNVKFSKYNNNKLKSLIKKIIFFLKKEN